MGSAASYQSASLPKCENPETKLRDLRLVLFEDTVRLNLADPGDVLVKRRKTHLLDYP